MSNQSKHVRVRHEGGIVDVRLLDKQILDELLIRDISAELDQVLADAPSPHMVLDFSDVEHLSSSALGMLITLNSRLQDRDGGLCLVHVGEAIGEVFRITRLDQVLNSVSDFTEARAALLGEA